MIAFKPFTFCKTAGDGYWSRAVRDVNLTGMRIAYTSEDSAFGELRVYFNTKFWDVDALGLIYTDTAFEQQLKQILAKQFGFTAKQLKNLCYSEQGMQGNNYVSFDVDSTTLINKFTELEAECLTA